MAWEHRGNGTYYYRSRKVDGRVVKDYYGAGIEADLAAREDTQRRREQAESTARLQQDLEVTAAARAAHEALSRASDALMIAALSAAGFHQHDRGPWRKRRGTQDHS